jgi:Helix-turn-helix domain
MQNPQDVFSLRMRDIDRLKVVKDVLEHRLNKRQAAELLSLSRRQVIRLCQRIQQEGYRGIQHKLRGRPSNRALATGLLERAISLLKQPRYAGFGPTFANEKLLELHHISLSTSVLRRGMIQAGLWRSKTFIPPHRAWRERRSCVGALIQLDGSDHDWFEGRGPRCVLLIYIDDATSRILYAEFVDVEDSLTLLATTQTYLRQHGRPVAFYVDKDSIYKVNRQASIEEELQDASPITQFTRAMSELGIEVLCANSPQAKGRVERSFGTHQDRLVKELRLAGISNKASANRFLRDIYIPLHNARFAVTPASSLDAHRPLLKSHGLDSILSLRIPRIVAQDFTVACQKRHFQILPHQSVRIHPKNTVLVETRLDGSTHLLFKDTYLHFKVIAKKRALQPLPKQIRDLLLPNRTPHKPASDHPWRTALWRPRKSTPAPVHV